MLDFAAAGDKAPRPVPAFMKEQAEGEPDARKVIAQLVEFWRGGLERTAPIFEVIRQAAALDPEIATLETERAQPGCATTAWPVGCWPTADSCGQV